MNQVFDLLQAINEKAEEYYQEKEERPSVVSISPGAYRRLLELRLAELADSGQELVLTAVFTLMTCVGLLRVLIDEMLADTVIELA